jgi:predicted amidophosphoribosyltransferase
VRAFSGVLDWLLPAVCMGCGVLLRGPCSPELCSRCAIGCAPWPAEARVKDGIAARYPYDGGLRAALLRCKFGPDPALAGPLGRALADDPWLSAAPDGALWDGVLALPTHPRRRFARGFDHARAITEHALASIGRRPIRGVLVRVRCDRPQSELPAAERRMNVRGSFVLPDPARVKGGRWLVVDDVTTTGATLEAATAAMRAAGATLVAGLALMRAC